jgi:hypothetical protein
MHESVHLQDYRACASNPANTPSLPAVCMVQYGKVCHHSFLQCTSSAATTGLLATARALCVHVQYVQVGLTTSALWLAHCVHMLFAANAANWYASTDIARARVGLHSLEKESAQALNISSFGSLNYMLLLQFSDSLAVTNSLQASALSAK